MDEQEGAGVPLAFVFYIAVLVHIYKLRFIYNGRVHPRSEATKKRIEV